MKTTSRGQTVASDTGAVPVPVTHDGQTRSAVVAFLLENGSATAGAIGVELGMSAAGIRRHLDALIAAGEIRAVALPARRQRSRGRPAKQFQLTPVGRGKLHHAYDDLAGAALRRLRDVAGDTAVRDFAADRIDAILPLSLAADSDMVDPDPDTVADAADRIAGALTAAGFSANTRRVGAGVQICQHHCPVAHVATEFPELCEAETARFTTLLGTHVQRLATIANGDCACTTHVPIAATAITDAARQQTRRTPSSAATPAVDDTADIRIDSPSATVTQMTSVAGSNREDSR